MYSSIIKNKAKNNINFNINNININNSLSDTSKLEEKGSQAGNGNNTPSLHSQNQQHQNQINMEQLKTMTDSLDLKQQNPILDDTFLKEIYYLTLKNIKNQEMVKKIILTPPPPPFIVIFLKFLGVIAILYIESRPRNP